GRLRPLPGEPRRPRSAPEGAGAESPGAPAALLPLERGPPQGRPRRQEVTMTPPPEPDQDLPPLTLEEFDQLLDELSEGMPAVPPLPANFSRADIYLDHD